MADLQSCFFCGTPEDLKQYAVVPPRFTDDGNPQTAVLCPQCKTKLLQVIEPLVDRLEGDGTEQQSEQPPQQAASQQEPPTPGSGGITMTPGGGSEPELTTNTSEPEPTTSDETGETEESAGGPAAPPSYRRAMRMLETREFPLDRTEVESLLANAYDLETHELDAVLSHAVEAGDLVEEDGQFSQPE